MRVLLHPYFFLPETWNGIDEHLLMLCRHMDRDRIEFLVLSHETHGPQTRLVAQRAGIPVVEAPCAPSTPIRFQVNALRNLYSREHIQLLHLHSPVAGGQGPAVLAARLAGVPVVATYHQIQSARLPRQSRFINWLLNVTGVSATIAVSQGVKHSLAECSGLRAEGIEVISNGIDVADERPRTSLLGHRRPSEVRVGYFGRLSAEKGVDLLLTALARLGPTGADLRAFIVGDGPERSRLEAQAERAGIADRVAFLGFRTDARLLMTEVDMVVHVPVYEGFGLVVLEAMAAGRPVIVNNAPGGLTEIVVPGETGVTLTSRSAQDLAKAIAALASDPDEQRRLGQNGRRRCIELFSAAGMADRTFAVYKRAWGRDTRDHFSGGGQRSAHSNVRR